jgi:hypothetical protein
MFSPGKLIVAADSIYFPAVLGQGCQIFQHKIDQNGEKYTK